MPAPVVYIGIDDTDIVGSPGTNQLARVIVTRLGALAQDGMICRHQLFFDARVPYTSKNGSASLVLPHADATAIPSIVAESRAAMLSWFIEGSDPGLCVTAEVPDAISAFGRHCQHHVVDQREARTLAASHGLHLEGLGGTEQGVIGALCAVGLVATGDDGRVVQLTSWPYPDDVPEPLSIDQLVDRGVHEARDVDTGARVTTGPIDVGKRLRPNLRGGRIVLFVTRCSEPDAAAPWRSVKLP